MDQVCGLASVCVCLSVSTQRSQYVLYIRLGVVLLPDMDAACADAPGPQSATAPIAAPVARAVVWCSLHAQSHRDVILVRNTCAVLDVRQLWRVRCGAGDLRHDTAGQYHSQLADAARTLSPRPVTVGSAGTWHRLGSWFRWRLGV
jgi:hypothetical protein